MLRPTAALAAVLLAAPLAAAASPSASPDPKSLLVPEADQEKARELGANAVVDMVSYYKKNEMKSAAEYECHAGAVVAGVALKGTVAKVAN